MNKKQYLNKKFFKDGKINLEPFSYGKVSFENEIVASVEALDSEYKSYYIKVDGTNAVLDKNNFIMQDVENWDSYIEKGYNFNKAIFYCECEDVAIPFVTSSKLLDEKQFLKEFKRHVEKINQFLHVIENNDLVEVTFKNHNKCNFFIYDVNKGKKAPFTSHIKTITIDGEKKDVLLTDILTIKPFFIDDIIKKDWVDLGNLYKKIEEKDKVIEKTLKKHYEERNKLMKQIKKDHKNFIEKYKEFKKDKKIEILTSKEIEDITKKFLIDKSNDFLKENNNMGPSFPFDMLQDMLQEVFFDPIKRKLYFSLAIFFETRDPNIPSIITFREYDEDFTSLDENISLEKDLEYINFYNLSKYIQLLQKNNVEVFREIEDKCNYTIRTTMQSVQFDSMPTKEELLKKLNSIII